MNKDNNQRFKETEQKIIHAYGKVAALKPIDKITVTDICKEADIHRTSFYGHFENMPALESYVCNLHLQTLVMEYLTENGWDLYEGITHQLAFFYQHKNLIRKNFSDSASIYHVNRFFHEILNSDTQQSYMKRYQLTSITQLHYHQCFIVSGFIEVLKNWILSDCKESPAEIASIICKFL